MRPFSVWNVQFWRTSASTAEDAVGISDNTKAHTLVAVLAFKRRYFQFAIDEDFCAFLDTPHALNQLAEAADGKVDRLTVTIAYCHAEVAVAILAVARKFDLGIMGGIAD
jgi:hypothetical protein